MTGSVTACSTQSRRADVQSECHLKVAEPRILAGLQAELRTPKALDAVVKGVEREAKRVLSATSETGAIDMQLLEERRKLQNLVSAIEARESLRGAL